MLTFQETPSFMIDQSHDGIISPTLWCNIPSNSWCNSNCHFIIIMLLYVTFWRLCVLLLDKLISGLCLLFIFVFFLLFSRLGAGRIPCFSNSSSRTYCHWSWRSVSCACRTYCHCSWYFLLSWLGTGCIPCFPKSISRTYCHLSWRSVSCACRTNIAGYQKIETTHHYTIALWVKRRSRWGVVLPSCNIAINLKWLISIFSMLFLCMSYLAHVSMFDSYVPGRYLYHSFLKV